MPGAIFVVAGSNRGQQGPVAALVSSAGWASAAERVLGRAWIATPSGIWKPADARRWGSDPSLSSGRPRALRRRLPVPVKTAAKDLRNWAIARRFQLDPHGPWAGDEIKFVWQRHELFQQAGLRLADQLGVPSVLFVPATIVWQDDQWGTRRPGWGRWLERSGDGQALRSADLVACGTSAVAEQVERLGVAPARILITPTGADLTLFERGTDRSSTRRRLGLDDRFVVGWVGSFRRFHGVEQAVRAAAAVDGATLLLVGDGPERPRIAELARALEVPATFTGTVEHDQLPALLAAMDVALVLAPTEGEYHYSPLKLAEYLAAGVAVVAPAMGQLCDRLTDGVDALLVPPHDAEALAEAVTRLRDSSALRGQIGRAGRALAEAHGSWDQQVHTVLEALGR